MKTFTNANLILPSEILYSSYLQTQHGKILGFGSMESFVPPQNPENHVISCEGKYLSPNFIDMHTHGAGGHDFMDGTTEAYMRACQTHLSHGTTGMTILN